MTRRNTFLIISAIFLVKLLFVLFVNVATLIPGSDAQYYLKLRDQALSGDILFTSGAEKFIAPVYPWFLALTGAVFGKDIFWIYFMQAVLGTVNVYVFYLIASNILNPKRALFVTGFYLLYFPVLILGGEILPSLLGMTLILLFFHNLFLALKEERRQNFVLSGVYLGLAALTRSVALYIPVIVLPLLLFYKRSLWKKYSVFLAVFILVLVPWSVRNFYVKDAANRNRIIIISQREELKAVSILKEKVFDEKILKISTLIENAGRAFLYPYRFSFIYSYNGPPDYHYANISVKNIQSFYKFFKQPKVVLSAILFFIHFALISFFALGIYKLIRNLRLIHGENLKFFYNLILFIYIGYISASILSVIAMCGICSSYYLLPALPFVTLLAGSWYCDYYT